jgi:hypothetical protein
MEVDLLMQGQISFTGRYRSKFDVRGGTLTLDAHASCSLFDDTGDSPELEQLSTLAEGVADAAAA